MGSTRINNNNSEVRDTKTMYKTIGLYKRMPNEEEFLHFYTNEIIPRLLNIPGVIKVEVTQLISQTNSPDDYFFMAETYFASPEALQQVLNSEEGAEVFSTMLEHAKPYLSSFIGKEDSFKVNLFGQHFVPKDES